MTKIKVTDKSTDSVVKVATKWDVTAREARRIHALGVLKNAETAWDVAKLNVEYLARRAKGEEK